MTQSVIEFQTTLADKYQPSRVSDYVGIDEPKRILLSLLKRPKSCNLLFVGPPGSGKTTIAMAFVRQLPGSLVHVPAQKCDVGKVDAMALQFMYMPGTGRWWIALIDEADQMTEKAQLQLLSRMDSTASMRPLWGGGYEKGTPLPIIWIFTSNGNGPDGVKPDIRLLPRFQSRCMVLPFRKVDQYATAKYLQRIWRKEGGRRGLPEEYFYYLADGVGVRDALMRLDVELLKNPTISEVKRFLNQQSVKEVAQDTYEADQWVNAAEVSRDAGVQQAITELQDAERSGASPATIARRKAMVTMKRKEAALALQG